MKIVGLNAFYPNDDDCRTEVWVVSEENAQATEDEMIRNEGGIVVGKAEVEIPDESWGIFEKLIEGSSTEDMGALLNFRSSMIELGMRLAEPLSTKT